ncbi:MAG: NADH-quinone oxidoreductase subunit C [Balneolaceae bacterium]
MKSAEEILEYLSARFPETEFEALQGDVGPMRIKVPASVIKDAAKFLRDDDQLQFNTLMCLSGLHYPKENELGVAYNLHSTCLGHSLAINVRVSEEQPDVPSVEQIWKTAGWHEREAYDMVGVRFTEHPDLRRILCPYDWEGHPLRKDYVQQAFYRGVTTKENGSEVL